jgi:hypothetical protein
MALANYVAVFNRQPESAGTPNDERKFKKGKIGWSTGPGGNVEIARVQEVEAESVAEAQGIIREAYPSNSSGTVVVITEAAYKES